MIFSLALDKRILTTRHLLALIDKVILPISASLILNSHLHRLIPVINAYWVHLDALVRNQSSCHGYLGIYRGSPHRLDTFRADSSVPKHSGLTWLLHRCLALFLSCLHD